MTPAPRTRPSGEDPAALQAVARIDEFLALQDAVGRTISLALSGLAVDLLAMDGGLDAGTAVSRAAAAANSTAVLAPITSM